jgi:carbamoyl-phosphate synthase small subunit
VMITSQNHGFAVDELSLGPNLEVTYRSLFDNSLQGFKHKSLPLFSFQGHPEAGPGPHDALSLFDDFIHAVRKNNAETFGFA